MQQVFVGDVQGCAAELDEILERIHAAFGSAFELWVVGDLINRGPANRTALARVRALVDAGQARFVLGNHELSFLAVRLGLRPLRVSDTLAELLEAPDCDEWFEWLRSRPLVETGQVGETPFVMVHAAVHPDWSLDEIVRRARAAEARLASGDRQDLHRFLASAASDSPERDDLGRFTSCRSVRPDGSWSKEEPVAPAAPWHAVWAERAHEYGVVYGHWSLQGLHVAPGLRGLDTGCVHHGRDHDGFLTAWWPDPNTAAPFAVPDVRFWQVRAHAQYFVALAESV